MLLLWVCYDDVISFRCCCCRPQPCSSGRAAQIPEINRQLTAGAGVFSLSKRNEKMMIAALTVAMLLFGWVSGAFAAEVRPLDVLYPPNLLPTVSFDGQFTADTLAYLEKLPAAEALKRLDVLRGSGGDLMLDRTANRMEGAAMLVRLLGAEKEALNAKYNHPFTDVDSWADPYIGYLYEKGLTNGIGNNQYGSAQPISEKAYLTFLMRALGYSDKNGLDFTYNAVEQAAIEKGLLYSGELVNENSPFKRARLSELSWRAMFLMHKTRNKPLLVCLYDQGMIADESVDTLLKAENPPLLDQWYKHLPELCDGLVKHEETIELLQNKTLAESDLQKYIEIIMERAQHETGVFVKGYLIESWLEGDEYILKINPRYANTLQEDQTLFAWVRQLVKDIIKPEMTDYQKVKTIHDFLIIALKYDKSSQPPESSYHAFGALNTGKALCGAYAELMVLMLKQAGVPCRMVVGIGNGLDHAWNIVYIDGEYYHVDTTWDDPVTDSEGTTLRYDYFNLTDEEMKKEHSWVLEDYPAATAIEQNFFVKEKLIVAGKNDLRKVLRETLNRGKTQCILKLDGFTVTEEEVGDMMIKINEEAGYPISAYRFSYNEEMQVILIESIEYN